MLAISYILWFVVNKITLKYFNVKEIVVNTYVLSGFIVLFLFYNDLNNSIKKINIHYIYLILLVLIVVFTNYILTYSCEKKINFGLIEGIAMGLYVPLVAIISYYLYNDNITFKNFVGLIFICFGVILTSK